MALIDLVNGAWDENRPPDPDLIKDCVHCGFCLPTCPSYLVFEEEMDSPRGRIVLMRVGHDDAAEVSDEMVTHFDRCLGCMACVTACPSGVQYDKLIEQTRPQIERHADRPLRERASLRSSCGRVRSISLSYWTPDGQAVTHAMQPRQRSKWVTISSETSSASSWPTRISTMRPRGESISSSKTA